jgi:hypothetical protein
MKIWSVLLVVVLLAVCAVAASSAPTFDGSTGIVTLPTAGVLPQGSLQLAISDMPNAPSDETYLFNRLSVGIAKNLELSASFVKGDEKDYWGYYDVITGGLKYRFLTQEKSGVDLAVGGSIGKEDDYYNKMGIEKAYLAISKKFSLDPSLPLTCRGTVGAMYNRFYEGDWSDSFTKPYVGVELLGKQGISLSAEYRWKDSDWDDDDALFSSVLRYRFPKIPLFIEAGTTNGEWIGSSWDNQRGFYGFGYTFDLSK